MTTDEYLAIIALSTMIMAVIDISRWLYSFISERK